MDGFFEFINVSFHSCDTNKSSLIVSEKNGAIQYVSDTMGSFVPDHFKKHIRFYPEDDFLYTTSDSGLGLRVWDRIKEKEIYRYPQDSLETHEYSYNRIIGCTSPNGIKLYDIRSRYHIASCPLPQALGLQWSLEDLYAFNDSKIIKYSLKKDSYDVIETQSNLKNVFVCQEDLFYIKQKASKNFLCKPNVDYEIETVGENGGVTRDSKLYVYGNNEIKVYGANTVLKSFGFVRSIEGIVFGNYNTYLFGDRKLYVKEGGLF